MRTKVLLCAAALAAGALTAVAQNSNVYSLNVVGYINLTLVPGYNLVNNQLDVDGTGTNNVSGNNTVVTVLGDSLPTGSKVYTWNAGGLAFNIATYAIVKGHTTPTWDQTNSLNCGEGAWILNPATTNVTVTTVGTVLQGPLSNGYLKSAAGYSLVGSQIPLTGGLQTALGYTPANGDVVYQWVPATTSFNINSYSILKGHTSPTWNPGEPSIGVSEGFWLNQAAAATWTTNFTVQ